MSRKYCVSCNFPSDYFLFSSINLPLLVFFRFVLLKMVNNFVAFGFLFNDAHQILTQCLVWSPPSDITLSVFTVTSKSLTVQWSGLTGASSYKITATPKYSSKRPVFAQFGGNTVIGSVNSLSPNTVYTVQLEAIDNALNVLSSAKTEETTGNRRTERTVRRKLFIIRVNHSSW